MTQVSSTGRRASQKELLLEAMRERRISARELAKRLAEREGLTVEAARRNITRWRATTGISDRFAWALADVLGYPADYFVKPRKLTLAEEMQSEQERQRREISLLKRQLAELRKSQPPVEDETERKTA